MTITQGIEDHDISFHPTAPPLPSALPATIDNYAPLATATAIPIVSATAVPDTPNISESSPTSSSLFPGRMNIERTTNSDGSLFVKVTRTTAQDDGYHHVRIEHYMIPATMANSVVQSMDINGNPPSSVYMTKIEDHRLPPGGNLAEELTSTGPASQSTPGMPLGGASGGGTTATPAMVMTDYERNRRKKCACFVFIFSAAAVWIILKISSLTMTRYSPPTPSYSHDDDHFNPSYPTPSYSYPMYLDDDWISRISTAPSMSQPQVPTESPYSTWNNPSSPSYPTSRYPISSSTQPERHAGYNDVNEKIDEE